MLGSVENIVMAGSSNKKSDTSAESQLDEFIDKYIPEVASTARACLKTMRARLPRATELVYDNYNALAIGFSPSEKASEGGHFLDRAIPSIRHSFFSARGSSSGSGKNVTRRWQKGSAHQARISQ
jgi:hypothetical protein